MAVTRWVARVLLVLGVGICYVGWANVGGLVPPFALCGYAGSPTVHLGENLALVYNGGCLPYDRAHEAFVLVTVTGLAGGGYLARQTP